MIKRVTGAAQILTRAEMIAELRIRIAGKSIRKWGDEWVVDFREISAVLRGKQYPGERLLEIMRLREESDVRYVRVNDKVNR